MTTKKAAKTTEATTDDTTPLVPGWRQPPRQERAIEIAGFALRIAAAVVLVAAFIWRGGAYLTAWERYNSPTDVPVVTAELAAVIKERPDLTSTDPVTRILKSPGGALTDEVGVGPYVASVHLAGRHVGYYWRVAGTAGDFCIAAWDSEGAAYTADAPYVYASAVGGVPAEPSHCIELLGGAA